MTTLELDQEETFALLNLLTDAIESDHYSLSPRVQLTQAAEAASG